MAQTTDYTARSFAPASVAVATRVASQRLSYVDMVRVVLTILVIMVHAAATYGGTGDWTYVDPRANDTLSSVLLSLFIIDCQAFFMGLFFFFSGYFTPSSYDRKGILKFWKDRVARIAIPMALYTWAFSRIPNYMASVARGQNVGTFWQYSLRTFWHEPDKGPTWFLFALLVFTVGYTLVRLAMRGLRVEEKARTVRVPAPNTLALLFTALVMAAAMFAIAQFMPIIAAYDVFGVFGIILGFFPFYIILFVAGILAYRNDWLTRLPARLLRFWGWLSVALVFALPAFLIASGAIDAGLDPYLSGSGWRCAIMCLWLGTACVAFSVSLTLWMREHVKPGNRLAQASGPNAFAIYLIHPLVLVPITVWLRSYTIHPLVKFGFASVATVAICYGLAEGLRRVPVIKRIL